MVGAGAEVQHRVRVPEQSGREGPDRRTKMGRVLEDAEGDDDIFKSKVNFPLRTRALTF